MNPVIRREWGASLFVATVILGAVAVAVVFLASGGKATHVGALAPCPSYTPWVSTRPPKQTTPTPKPKRTATPVAAVSATPYDISTANCPTAPTGPEPAKTAPGGTFVPGHSLPPGVTLPPNLRTAPPASTPTP